MTLLVKRAGKAEYGNAVKVLVAGASGQGKTRFSSTAPNVLYAATSDAGLMSVVDRQCPFVEINKVEDLELLRVALVHDPETRKKTLGVYVDTVVIDTLDGVQRLLIEERMRETKKDQLTIQDYGWLGDQLRGFVRGFRNLPIHTIFTVHCKSTEDADTGRTYVKPALMGAMADEVSAYVDIAMLLRAQPRTMVVNGESRKVLVRTAQTSPDSQHSWLKDRSGKLPMEFEVNLDDDFSRIYRFMFGDDAELPETEAVTEVPDVEKTPTPTAPAKKTAAKKAAAAKKDVPERTLDTLLDAAPPEPTPEPEPEPEVPEPEAVEPEPKPEPIDLLAETEDETTQEPEEPKASESAEKLCESCGTPVTDPDQLDLSILRFRKIFCRPCFVEQRTR